MSPEKQIALHPTQLTLSLIFSYQQTNLQTHTVVSHIPLHLSQCSSQLFSSLSLSLLGRLMIAASSLSIALLTTYSVLLPTLITMPSVLMMLRVE